MVDNKSYIPERSHAVWISLSPQAGHEQADRRPSVVLSPQSYNEKVGLALFCPITSQVKGYPFEVSIPEGLDISGVVLSDQIKSLDWRAWRVEFICSLPNTAIEEVIAKARALLD